MKALLSIALGLGLIGCASEVRAAEWVNVAVTERVIQIRPKKRIWRDVYYRYTPRVCRYAWRVDEYGGPSGICVPGPYRGTTRASLAPYGSKRAGEFYREVDADHFGSSE